MAREVEIKEQSLEAVRNKTSEDMAQQVFHKELEAFGGEAVHGSLSQGNDEVRRRRPIRKFERFLVEFKKVCGMSPVLVEDLDREVRDAGGRSKEGRSEEPNGRS